MNSLKTGAGRKRIEPIANAAIAVSRQKETHVWDVEFPENTARTSLRAAWVALIWVGILSSSCPAQCTFSSGSTGADGAFNPTNSMPGTGWSINGNVITVTNKSDGVFNFTSIYVETNWTVKFTKNALNTPVYLLATTNATIKGTIDVSGGNSTTNLPGVGGPGGYDGGLGKLGLLPAGNGFGPGAGLFAHIGCCDYWGSAGYAVGGQSGSEPLPAGKPYGTLDMMPFIGGSGGAGANSSENPGGSGGGAILIASSATLDITGSIRANGGDAAGFGNNNGGGGSGGSIRLIAKTIQGEGLLSANAGGIYNNKGSYGRVRLEACTNLRITPSLPPSTFGTPTSVFLATNPTIQVSSIAGQGVSWPPAGSLTTPDLLLATNFSNPATISVLASNVPVGTAFKVIVTPVNGTNVEASSTLSGTYAASTGSVSMSVYTDRVWRVNAQIDYVPRP